MTRRRTRAIVALTACIAVVAACGDDDGGSLFDDDPSDGEASDDDTPTEEASSGEFDDYCGAATAIRGLDDDFGDELTNPDAIELFLSEYISAAEAASDLAPDEISGDVAVVIAAMRGFQDEFAAGDYNVLDVRASAFVNLFSNPEVEAASDNISAYGVAECGFPADDDDGDLTDAASDFEELFGGLDDDATIRDGFAAEFERGGVAADAAECIAAGLEPQVLADDDASAVIGELIVECSIDPQTGQPVD